MDLDCDISQINNEELLRRMWQQSQDVNRKKEIRSHLYKLRETRLRDLYTAGEDALIMSGNSATGFGKDPLLPSHGDSLADQSFQSLKSKEVRDSASPTSELKFHSLALNNPNTNTGWDVRSSSEVTPDGRGFRSETVATTDGVENINGGVAEFKGRNEQRSSASHQGDDKNFVKKASESADTHLQENVVIGDDKSGRTEMKMSSTTTSSSSQVISSSSTGDDGEPFGRQQNRYLTDNTNRQYDQHQQQHHNQQQQQRFQDEQYRREEQQYQQQLRQQHEEQHRTSSQQQQSTRQEHQQREQHTSEEYNKNRQENTRNVETESHYEENKRYVDMDKASPEYQRQVQNLMSQPGEIISNTVEYPKPNVKMITTVKRLPDGTIVKNKRYETEDVRPTQESVHHRTTTSSTNTSNQRNTQQRRTEEENLQTRLRNSRERNTTTQNDRQISPRRPFVDDVDNSYPSQVVSHPNYNEDVTNVTSNTSSFSTVKKSSRRFSTETTSETVEESDDRTPSHSTRGKPQDFSTHGFPSVKPNKPTQEYASDRPRPAQPPNDFSTQGFPSVKPHKPTREYPTDRPSPVRTTDIERTTHSEVSDLNRPGPVSTTVRTIKTPDGDVVIVSKETQRTVKQKSNSERIIESEFVSDNNAPQITHSTTQHHKSEDFSTHGFPSVKETSPVWDDKPRHGAPAREHHHHPPTREDFTTHGFPSVKESSPVWDDKPRHGTPTRPVHHTDEEYKVSSSTTRTSNQKSNAERVIEVVTDKDYPHHGAPHPERISNAPHEDFSTHGFPSVRGSKPARDIFPQHYTPVRSDRPISPRRSPDASRHGYPSARSPTRTRPDYSTHGFPSARSPTRSRPDYSGQGFPTARDVKPKPRPSHSPQRKVQTTSTRKPTSSTTTTDSSHTVRKQKEVDATHRAFAASLRSTSPVDHTRRDSHDHPQRHTPRSSVSSTTTSRTYRRDMREGSHDSTAPSETSRISSSTVTRQSPIKTPGKTVVTKKQTVVKTRNVNGSNETIDLTPQRSPTKSPSPGKIVTTTTTTTTTTNAQRPIKTPISPTSPKATPTPTTKAPTTEVPKTDNQLTKPPAAMQFPINEPLTITKTAFASNDAILPRNEAIIEEPICRKKHFYQLGPSDETTTLIETENSTTTTTTPTTTTTITAIIPTRTTNLLSQIIHNDEPPKISVPSNDDKKLTAEEVDALTEIFDNAAIPVNGELASPPTTEATETVTKTSHTETTKSPTYSPTAPNSHKTHRTSQQQQHYVIKKDSPEREYEPIRSPESDVINEPLSSLTTSDVEPNERSSPQKSTKIDERRTVLRETTFEKVKQQKKDNNKKQTEKITEPFYDSDEPSVTSDFEPYRPNDQTLKSSEPEKKYPLNRDKVPSGKPFDQPKYPKTNEPERVEELFNVTQQKNRKTTTKNINHEFINSERGKTVDLDESTDGLLISKDTTLKSKPETPTSPTFKKKGLSRRETFEERCKQILGMEDNGDTQGKFSNRPETESETDGDKEPKSSKPKKPTTTTTTKDIEFIVKIEDCDDDDDDRPLSINTTPKRYPRHEVVDTVTIENISQESKQNTTRVSKGSPERVLPEKKSPQQTPKPERRSPEKTSATPTYPSRHSPERRKSPEKQKVPHPKEQPRAPSQSPERSKPTKKQPNSKYSNQDIEFEFEITPKQKSPSPTRKSKSPSPTRKSKSPSPTRYSPSINKETTIELVTTTTRRANTKSPSPGPKSKPKQPAPLTDSEIDTESPIESDVDTIKENYIVEKVINSKKNITTKTPTVQKTPKTYIGGPSKLQTETVTTTTTTRKSVPHKTTPTKPADKISTPIKKAPTKQSTKNSEPKPLDIQTEFVTEKQKTSKFATNTTVKTTAKHTILPKQDSPVPTKTTPSFKQRPGSSVVTKTTEEIFTSKKKPKDDSPVPTIKERLRSATRRTPTKSKITEREGSLSSSPESSPTRSTERRRSSNISVHTEIIIEHAGSKSPERESPVTKKQQPSPKKPTKDAPDTVLSRKLPVTERKESAPVNRVTRRDDDIRMSRSTSENIIKVNGQTKPTGKKPAEPSSLSPKNERRPNKCFTTKTINLTTNDRLINSEEMENVIIDIQHAKSSREQSPDKIVPTPVPANMDTGKPRYPDVVQEPEDTPRRRPVVKNIPILEEDTNSFVGCHISEVKIEKTTTAIDNTDYNDEILTQPMVEAPISLEYPSIDKPDDECLLSVHEKVSKFTNTAKEVSKPKTSSPFNPIYEKGPELPEDDECLLTVDQKVTKFLKTAESITKTPIPQPRDIERPNLEKLDDETRRDECNLSVSEKVNKFITTAEKLAPSAPQKSPELVARMERHISRQSEPGDTDNDTDEPTSNTPFSENHTVELEIKRQKDILTRPSIWDNNTPLEPFKKQPEDDDDELIPMTKNHTTEIEIRRQKDILTRPSVFEGKKSPSLTPTKAQSPLPTKKSTILDRMQRFETSTQRTTDEEHTITSKKPIKPMSSGDKKHSITSTTVTTSRSRFEPTKPNKEPKFPVEKQTKTVPNGRPTTSTRKPSTEHVTTEEIESEVEFIDKKHSSSNITTKTTRSRLETTKVNKEPKFPKENQSKPISNGKSPKPKPASTVTVSSRKPSTDHITDETESDKEFIETEESISRRSSTKSSKFEIEKTSSSHPKTPKEVSHSPTRRSSSSSPSKSTTATTRVTERTYSPHHTTTGRGKSPETLLTESIIESTTRSPVPSVTERRTLFEKETTESSPQLDTRRPSYMDHTRSSLEHIRRDSLEVNKTHYARKPSVEEDTQYPQRPNSAVKFDVPHKPRKHESISEDIDIEEIFDLEVLEEMLETVTSYELRRRIRAQIRLVKKNALNTTTQVDSKVAKSSTSSTMHKSSIYSSNSSHHHHQEETNIISDEKHVRKPSPNNRTNSPKSRAPEATKYSPKPRERSYSPTEVKTVSSSDKHYTRTEQVHYTDEKDTAETRHSPERTYPHERRHSPSSKPPIKPRERSQSPEVIKKKSSPYPKDRSSPTSKPRDRSPSPQQKSGNITEEKRSTVTKSTTHSSTYSPERKPSKPKSDEKTPLWADRKNILKTPSNQSPVAARKAPISTTNRTSATKTTKSIVSQRQRKSEEDSITSSYGIGPTDENGLPLFGIRALKKKNAKPVEPCETNKEVTGYVIEEQWYSDGTKVPKHERKEFIYSTNEDELKSMKKQVESRKSSKDDVHVTRKFKKIDKDYDYKEPQALMSPGSTDEFATTKKFGRRGSVKEMSEKFIRKESSQSMTEKSSTKSNTYPKAGLILRTSSRKGSLGNDDGGDLITTTITKTTKTTKKQPNESNEHYDFESEHAHEDYEHEQQTMARSFHESESECESMSTKRETLNKKSSSSSMSTATRSFLNSTGETRVVTDVDDVLERMRNADNVVEEGDTAEDQEARALLNKFLGASVIMRGVETAALPKGTKTITSTTYNDGDKVTTTRVTKTTKSSGSSSTPVTYTTCDIEEIWDEEVLKQLLERATTYEERRKIRARLRELMAEREEKSSAKLAEKSAETAHETEESSASEYEEIIEEVTDYSDAEEEQKTEPTKSASQTKVTSSEKSSAKESVKNVEKTTEKIVEVSQVKKEHKISTEVTAESAAESTNSTTETTTSAQEPESEPEPEKSEKEQGGESLLPFLQDLLHKSRTPSKQAASKKQTTIQQSSKISNTNSNNKTTNKTASSSSKQSTKTNTNKTVVGGSVSSCNSSGDSTEYNKSSKSEERNSNSSSSCTVLSVSNNNKNSSDSSLPPQQVTTATTNKDDMTNEMKKSAQSTGQHGTSTAVKIDRLNVPQREDSGTESGEDLRLIAAGLRDRLQLQNGDSSLIEEVTTALSKLECSLKEGNEITLDGPKRKALLALVARLQTGLISPEQLEDATSKTPTDLSEINEPNFEEISSPEMDNARSGRHRFAKRRNRNSRHTVGVSREELADARRYMEDMLMMGNISNTTTPDSGLAPAITTPQCSFPIEKNASSGAILCSQPLFRPNQFVPPNIKTSTDCLTVDQSSVVLRNSNGKNVGYRRPLSGEYSVSFEQPNRGFASDGAERNSQNNSPESGKNRFNSKRQLMKRANTIDIPKSKKYNPDLDTDSDGEDRGPHFGLKRTVQVSVKQKVRHVVPAFEPKTENDHKFLAFINKQSPKPGLGWTGSRSVSNWTNKFGNIKNTFEVGAAATATTGKPPQIPGHQSSAANRKQNPASYSDYGYSSNQHSPQHSAKNFQWQQQQQQMLQQQQQQQQQLEATERQRLRMERDRIERERIERDRLERQRYERERMERDRLEREHFEKERMEKERLEREFFERERERVARERLLAAQQQQQQQLLQIQQQKQQQQLLLQQQKEQLLLQQHQQQQLANEAAPVNQFIHAPQSVFKPIENGNPPPHDIYKPIPQAPNNGAPVNTWQPPNSSNGIKPKTKPSSITSPQFLSQKHSPYTSSPSSTATSPIGLPWLSKPAVNNSDFRAKANRFEEASLNDNRETVYASSGVHGLHRHNSLRAPRVSLQSSDDFRKRPSLPNAADPYQPLQSQYVPPYYDLPPPTNISFRYNDSTPKLNNYKSVPCLPTAVDASMDPYPRSRKDSLTNPKAIPLVLTSSNPTYGSHADNLQNIYPDLSTSVPRQFEYMRPNVDSAATSPSIGTMPQTDYTDDDLDLDSDNNLLEYRVQSKVMRKPQCQTAVTVGRRTAHVSDDEVFGKNSSAAKNLLHTMKSLNNGNQRSNANDSSTSKKKSTPMTSPTPAGCLSPDGRSYQAPLVEPLFPEVTNFTANREPAYTNKPRTTKSKQVPLKPYRDMPYKPPQSKLPPNVEVVPPPRRILGYDRNFSDQSVNYQSTVRPALPPAPVSAPAPFISETQTSYVVTYPMDDQSDVDEHYAPKIHPTSLPLQRSRNVSENSTASSSVSYSYNNMPSPNTNWTTNPVHLNTPQQQTPTTAIPPKQNIPRPEEKALFKQPQQQFNDPHIVPSEPSISNMKPKKPDLAPKPQATSTPASYQELTQQYYQLPLPQEQQQQRHPKLKTRSQTISTTETQIYESTPNAPQTQKSSLLRQRTVDNSVSKTSMTPLQTQNHVLSQQSLVAKQQSQFEQKQQRNQQVTEARRKSLGHILDAQEQQRKSTYFESQQTEIIKREEYKSSAPADTPDIVKSSLPKDENAPILKKFGPPQRHHYIPNAYQTPSVGVKTQSVQSHSETKKTSSGSTTKVTQRQIVQHSSLTTKPSIIETPATPQPQDANSEDLIPRNIVFNNVNAFTSMTRRQMEQERTAEPIRINRLSKSDSWNQICQIQQQAQQRTNVVSPKFNNSGNELRRTKSGHSLAVPKMYEAGMKKEEINEKQRTVAAYFSGQKSPNSSETTEVVVTKKSTINRTKTSEKASANRKSLSSSSGTIAIGGMGGGGLMRSATMPSIANVNLLDESNVEDAFEQLMMAQQAQQQDQKLATSTSEKTETEEKDGAIVTTTTKVTTRTVSGGTASKPISPFSKFKQLDRQSSQQKSPSTPTTPGCSSTPTTPGGSAPMFKFTDPALNARAATVKDQLLQWCQFKTKEYENVQITNFSTSWTDGLAFCALIHHFLPDAFDYSKLTPKSRRHNFELAFTVADEKAGIAPLLDVEDMVIMKRPDWKSVFVYVQSIYRRFRNCQ